MQCFSGGGERVRTDDLLRARQALSQLSYTPEKAALKMVGLDGFEPSTSRLSGVRSNRTELQAQVLSTLYQPGIFPILHPKKT